jgi:hypothetical protein
VSCSARPSSAATRPPAGDASPKIRIEIRPTATHLPLIESDLGTRRHWQMQG